MEKTLVVAFTILIALIFVPLAIHGVERVDQWLARGFERVFGAFKRRK